MMRRVSLGTTRPRATGTGPPGRPGPLRSSSPAEVAPAVRARRSAWRDLRLWLGLLVVAGSVVAGTRLLAAADDTVGVWAVPAAAGPGARLDPAQLEVRHVRFGDEAALAAYFTVDDALPADLLLVRGVGAGELLPRAALGDAERVAGSVELPVAVDPDQVPPSVATGSVVDVYLVGGRGSGPAIQDATVVAAPPATSAFGATTGRRQLVLAVPPETADAFLERLGRARQPLLTVVRQG